MRLMLAAAAAKLLEFQTTRRFFLVLVGHVVAFFALRALQNDVVSHKSLNEELKMEN
jgi:hypothetical protein